tara:strand:- start:572 stop:1057 length:486 start_codon:yes stop_codon:yes gene_type:complete
MQSIFIFDLDDTTVDSSHRTQLNADGSINLAHWRKHSTAENIMRDSMLPLADRMIEGIADGLDIVILTSRVITKVDLTWLKMRGMIAPTILSRSVLDDRPTGEYKLARLHELAIDRRMSFADLAKSVIMWDDCKNVQSVLRNAGIRVIDPVQYNLTQKDAV